MTITPQAIEIATRWVQAIQDGDLDTLHTLAVPYRRDTIHADSLPSLQRQVAHVDLDVSGFLSDQRPTGPNLELLVLVTDPAYVFDPTPKEPGPPPAGTVLITLEHTDDGLRVYGIDNFNPDA